MPELPERLKKEIRLILGDLPSSIFLARIDKAIDEAGTDPEALKKAAVRVAGMVKLFIGAAQAKEIEDKCRAIFNP